jgi:hypothetical protein
MLSGWAVGWLLLVAAVVVFVAGFVVRSYVGRSPSGHPVRRLARKVRWSGFGRVFYGPVARDAEGNNIFDDEELDQMIVMPTLIVACGLFLTGVFLLFYQLINH